MRAEKPVGSGYFAAGSGVVFLGVVVLSFFDAVIDWTLKLSPADIIRIWCLAVGLVLIIWGVNRVRTGDPADTKIGQDTINFVVTILAATFALIALIRR